MANRPDLVGERFGRLTVQSFAEKRGARRLWNCACDCGNAHKASTSDLRYGSVQSCGCLLAGPTAANVTHGHNVGRKHSKTYSSYRAMLERCNNPTNKRYRDYGGRGITVCERWLACFENFLDDMGERPEDKTLDRIEVNGNYEPGNCRWATALEQHLNQRPRAA